MYAHTSAYVELSVRSAFRPFLIVHSFWILVTTHTHIPTHASQTSDNKENGEVEHNNNDKGENSLVVVGYNTPVT